MARRKHHNLLRTMIVQTLSVAGIAALALNPLVTPVLAADHHVTTTAHSSSGLNAKFLALGIGKSIVVDLPRDVKDVLVADPKIANAVVRSSQRAYIIGAAVGQTNIVFFDAAGQQIAAYDIAVKRDLNGIRAALRQVLPGADIRIEGLGDGVMLSGSVASPADAQQAQDIAVRLVGDEKKVVNSIAIRGRDQVMLKVVVAEVQRNIVKQLGVDLSANLSYGTAVVNFNNTNSFSANGSPPANGSTAFGFGHSPVPGVPAVEATLRAMETAGVVRTLAEPSLTAISGESANFLAGGELPIPGPPTCTGNVCTPTIQFKKFGVSLGFTPVVMSGGRISLHVSTEVSEVSQDNSLTIQGTVIPSLRTRRADTTLEIPSGGSMVMAGLIQQQTKQAMSGLPGIARLPILGTLFRSRDFVRNNTELMVLVTPYVVRAVAQKDLSRPDDGFEAAPDPQAALLGSINRIYGVPNRRQPMQAYRGTFGFITD